MKPRLMSEWTLPAASRAIVPCLDGPGADLVGADGEEANQAKRFVAGVDEFARGGFGYAQIGHKLLPAFGVELRKLIFELWHRR